MAICNLTLTKYPTTQFPQGQVTKVNLAKTRNPCLEYSQVGRKNGRSKPWGWGFAVGKLLDDPTCSSLSVGYSNAKRPLISFPSPTFPAFIDLM